jgi:hypothetical protein
MSFWQRKAADDANHGKGQKSPQEFKSDTTRQEYQASYNDQKAATRTKARRSSTRRPARAPAAQGRRLSGGGSIGAPFQGHIVQM